MRARRHDTRTRGVAVNARRPPRTRPTVQRTAHDGAAPACLCSHTHILTGLTNRTLRILIAGLIPGYNARQMTHDHRRLRRKGFIQRIPRSHRYELTNEGYRPAAFFTKTHTRIVNPTLAELDPALPAEIDSPSPTTRTWRAYEHQLDARIAQAALTS
jgi:hypothetical protein